LENLATFGQAFGDWLLFNTKEQADWNEFVGGDGTLTLQLKVTVILPCDEEQDEEASIDVDERFLGGNNNVAYQCGDVENSDVTICVVSKDKKEVRTFNCHSHIISGVYCMLNLKLLILMQTINYNVLKH